MASKAPVSETTPLLQDSNASSSAASVDDGSPAVPRSESPSQNAAGAQAQLKYIVPAISIGVFLSAADQTIIVASYGKIGSDLNALNLTSWIATSYFLTLTSFQPLYGRLSDIFGRKACLLFAYAIFGTGCIFCGTAVDIKQLIAARVYQGIGGGGMTTVVSILLSDIVPLRDRGVWQGIINIIYATGSSVGAPLGGILADYIGWRWAFVAQGPICLLAFIMVSVYLQVPEQEKEDWRVKLRRVDFLGALVLIGAVFGALFGLDRGSNVAWSIPITYIPLAISAVLFVIFGIVEVYVAAEPFAPSYIVTDPAMLSCYGCNFFSFAGWMAACFYLPLYFQAVDGASATVSGLRLLPTIIAGTSGSLFSGLVMRWTGRYYWLTIAGYSSLTTGLVIIFLCSGAVVDNVPVLIIGTVFSAFGNGIGVTTTLIGLISSTGPENQAVVTACSYLFRSLGSVMGLSLSSTLIQQLLRQRLRSALKDADDADQIVDGVRQSLDYIMKLPPQIRDTVRGCYGWSVNLGFAFMIGIVFLALLSSFFIRERSLSR
ncbi:hypothetical protein VTN49DRAFT_6369 [Thermomyces lanuginosus]|uniref:uncharacterized protein n=1 Tax=Thermomyces lanuginosus TaxID=5541 RepID=UPI003744B0A9